MPDYNKNINKAWEAIQDAGGTQLSEKEFKAKMAAPNALGYQRQVYNSLVSAGYDVGSFQYFVDQHHKRAPKTQPKPKSTTAKQASSVGAANFGGQKAQTSTTALEQAQAQMQNLQQNNQGYKPLEGAPSTNKQSFDVLRNKTIDNAYMNSKVVHDKSAWDSNGMHRATNNTDDGSVAATNKMFSSPTNLSEGVAKAKKDAQASVSGKTQKVKAPVHYDANDKQIHYDDAFKEMQNQSDLNNKKVEELSRNDAKNAVGNAMAEADKEFADIIKNNTDNQNGLADLFNYDDQTMQTYKANAEVNPKDVLEKLQKNVAKSYLQMVQGNLDRYKAAAENEGMSVLDYIQQKVAPSLQKQIQEEFDKSQIARYMPETSGEAIANGTYKSIIGGLARLGTTTTEQRQYQDQAVEKYNEAWKERNKQHFAPVKSDGSVLGDIKEWAVNQANDVYASGLQTGQMALGMAVDAPLFKLQGGLAEKFLGKIGMGAYASAVGKEAAATTSRFLEANAGYIESAVSHAARMGTTLSQYGATNAVVTELSNGNTNLASIGVSAAHAFRNDLINGTVMGGIGGTMSKLGAGIGVKAGDSAIKAMAHGTEKALFNMVGLLPEGFGMHLGEQTNSYLEGNGFNLTWQGTLEGAVTAGALKLTSGDSYRNFKEKARKFFMAENTLSDAEWEDIFKATDSHSKEEVMSKIFVDGWKATGNASEEVINNATTNYLNMMNQLAWDTQQKITAGTMNMASASRPRTASFSYEGNTIKELDKDGNVLSVKKFNTKDEAQAFETQKKLYTENNDFFGTYGKAILRDPSKNHEYVNSIIEQTAEANGVKTTDIVKAMMKEPIRRTEQERALLREVEQSLHSYAFPDNELHTEQSAIDGKNVEDAADVTGENPNTEVVQNLSNEVDQAKADFDAARADALWAKDYDDSKSPADNFLILRGDGFGYNESELEPIIKYLNATAKQQGFMDAVYAKIKQKVSYMTNLLTSSRITINEQERDKSNIITLMDPDGNVQLMVAGDIRETQGGLENDQPIIVTNRENGECKAINNLDGWKIADVINADKYAANLEELYGQNATAVVDPTGKLSQAQQPTTPQVPQGGGQGGPQGGENGEGKETNILGEEVDPNRKGHKQITRATQKVSQAYDAYQKEPNDKNAFEVLNAINLFRNNHAQGAEATENEIALFDQMEENLKNDGYEITPLLGKNYSEGMRLEGEFVYDETLPKGARIITQVNKPQIVKNGVLAQKAHIVVSQNIDGGEGETHTYDPQNIANILNGMSAAPTMAEYKSRRKMLMEQLGMTSEEAESYLDQYIEENKPTQEGRQPMEFGEVPAGVPENEKEIFDAKRKQYDKNKTVGNETFMYLPNGERIKGHIVLHEATDVMPSHDPLNNFEQTPGVPRKEDGRTNNDRNYQTDQDAQQTVRGHAATFRLPNELPVVSYEGVTLSGNDRTQARLLAAENGTDGKYLADISQKAKEFGFTEEDLAKYKHPTVSFEIDGPVTYDTKTYAKFNANEKKRMNSTESAVKYGKVLEESPSEVNIISQTLSKVDSLNDLYDDVEKTKTVFDALVRAGVWSELDRANYLDRDGYFTRLGEMEFENAMRGFCFTEEAITILDKGSMKSVSRELAKTMPELVKNNTLGEYSIMGLLEASIKSMYEAVSGGHYKEGNIFSYFLQVKGESELEEMTRRALEATDEDGNPIFDNEERAIGVVLANALAKTRNRATPKFLNDLIADYNKSAVEFVKETEGSAGNLFGDDEVAATPKREDILHKQYKKVMDQLDSDIAEADKAIPELEAKIQAEKNSKNKTKLNKELKRIKDGREEAIQLKRAIEAISLKPSDRRLLPGSGEGGGRGRVLEGKSETLDKHERGEATDDDVLIAFGFEDAEIDKVKKARKILEEYNDVYGEAKDKTKLKDSLTQKLDDILEDKDVTTFADDAKAEADAKPKLELSDDINNAIGTINGYGPSLSDATESMRKEYYEAVDKLKEELGKVDDKTLKDYADSDNYTLANYAKRELEARANKPDEQSAKLKAEAEEFMKGVKVGDTFVDKKSGKKATVKEIAEGNNVIVEVGGENIAMHALNLKTNFDRATEPKTEPKEPLNDDTLTFEQRIKGTDKLKAEDLDSLPEDEFGPYLKTQIKSAIEKLQNGQPLSNLEKLFYLKALQNVRTTNGRGAQDSTNENGAQLAPADNAPGLGGDGQQGTQTPTVDRPAGGETKEGQSGGSNSEDNVHQPTGSGSDQQVSGAESGHDGVPAGGMESGRSSGTGSDGRNVRQRGGKETGSTASTDVTRDELKSGLEAKKQRLAELKKHLLKPSKPKPTQTYAGATMALGAWLGKMGDRVDWKTLGEFCKVASEIGVDYVRLGMHDFPKWAQNLKGEIGDLLKDAFGWGDAELDDYVREMWNSSYEMDGETHTIGEWASIIGNRALRKEIGRSLEEKKEQQKSAESVKVKVGDRDNIDETLPYLLPEQRDDVFKAETQFFDEKHQDRNHGNGKGMMFTNGTGTGKTYTGLGIVKRFVKQGKGRVLIVTPSQPKVNDWIKDGTNLGLNITSLENMKDAGEGVVITTYANIRGNEAILRDTFDLVVYDESHKIMENKKGEETIGTQVHYLLTNKDQKHAFDRIKYQYEPYRRERDLRKEYDFAQEAYETARKKLSDKFDIGLKEGPTAFSAPEVMQRIDQWIADIEKEEAGKENDDTKEKITLLKSAKNICKRISEIPDEIKALEPAQKALVPEITEKADKAVKTTKTVFLSATPFNRRENLRYAEGYIFSYPEENKNTIGTYNHRNPEQQFLETHFSAGYRFRYGRLENHVESPEALARQEVQFSDYLQQQLGTLSTRQIKNGYDYSRSFPTVTLDKAERFNQALQDVWRDEDRRPLRDAFHDVFHNYNKQTALFETMKTSLVAERIKEHLKRGRKVVVFHRRRTTNDELANPFRQALDIAVAEAADLNPQDKAEIMSAVRLFESKYEGLLKWEQTLDYRLPREQLAAIFGEDNVAFFSGAETKSQKNQSIDDFMKDNEGKDIIIVQEASGKEGISLHDKTGEHQRAQISLCLPQSPIAFIQSEGRIFRIGQKSNAIFEYPLLGLNHEINLWAQEFNSVLGTTENLAMGSKARNIAEAISKGVLEHSGIIGFDNVGVGGVEYDGNVQEAAATGFDAAIQDYFTNQKLNGRRDNREGDDYFPTPEPLGFKMVEWGGLTEGETALEPSAGHGAIARYVPTSNLLTSIEPSQSLQTKLRLNVHGSGRKFVENTFENYDIHNKHDVVVMNPPYGAGGATAVAHVGKAFQHLNEGGRVIAVVPNGPACDKKMNKWLEENPSAVVTGEVLLPSCTFGRAGTSVNTRIVIIDKVTREEAREGMPTKKTVDLRSVENVQDLFDEIRDVDMPQRTIDKVYLRDKIAKNSIRKLKEDGSLNMKALSVVAGNENFLRVEFKHHGGSEYIDLEHIQNSEMGALSVYDRLKNHKNGIQDFMHDREYSTGRGDNKVTAKECDIMRDVYDQLMQTVAKVAGTTVDKLDRKLEEYNKKRGNQPVNAETAQPVEPQPTEAAWNYKTIKHTKTGEDLHIVSSDKHMTDEEYKATKELAKKFGGFWDRYSKGFRFPNKEAADRFTNEVGGNNTRLSENLDSKENINNNNFDLDSDEKFVSLPEKEETEYYDTITDIADRANSKESRMDDASPVVNGGFETTGHRAASIIAHDIARRSEQVREQGISKWRSEQGRDASGNDSQNGDEESPLWESEIPERTVAERITEWAKRNNTWFDLSKDFNEKYPVENRLGDGTETEADVFKSKDGKTVLKLIKPHAVFGTVGEKLDEIANENVLFGEEPRKVIGFTDGDWPDEVRIAVEQPFVDGKTVLDSFKTEEEGREYIDNLMREKGFTKHIEKVDSIFGKIDNVVYSKDGYEVRDVNHHNVIIDTDGKPHIIDCVATKTNKTKFRTADEWEDQTDIDSKETIKTHIDEVSSGLNEPVTIHNDISTVTNAKAKKALEEGQDVHGWYNPDTGKVELYMPNIHSRYDAERTILHETVGHKGLRGIMNTERNPSGFNKFMDAVWADKSNVALHDFVKKYMPRKGWDMYEAIDEWLAREAENPITDENFGMWSRVKAAFNTVLRMVGLKHSMSINDVRYAIWIARHSKENPNDPWFKARRAAVRWSIEHGKYEPASKDGAYVSKEKDGNTRLSSALTSMGKAVKAQYETMMRTKEFHYREAFHDNMESLKVLQKLITGKDIYDVKDSENAYIAENHMTSKSEAEWNKFKVQKFQPLEKAINQCVGMYGGDPKETLSEVEGYAMKKSGLERNRKLFVRDAIDKIDDDATREQVQQDWDNERHRISADLKNGTIDYREYLSQLDDFIRDNIAPDYDPNKNDYSGISFYDPARTKKGRSVEYDENSIIDDVMNTESMLGDKADNLWKAVKDATDYSVDYSYRTGMASSSTRDHIKDMFDFYVPLRGFAEDTMEDVNEYIGSSKGIIIDNPLKNAKGRLSPAESPFAHISAMANTAITQGERNLVKQSFYRMIANNKNDATRVSDIWEEKVVDMRDPVTGEPTAFHWEMRQPKLTPDMKPEAVADAIDQFESDMKAKKLNGDARILKGKPKFDKRFEHPQNASQHAVPVYINGRMKVAYVLGNPRAAQALNGQLSHENTNNKFYKMALNGMASLVTSFSPEFILSNTSRDTLFSSANIASKENAAYFAKFTKNQAIAAAHMTLTGIGGDRLNGESLFEKYYRGHIDTSKPIEKMFAEFMDNGGRTGFVAQRDIDTHLKEIKANIKGKRGRDKLVNVAAAIGVSLPKAVEQMNMRAELINRFATYMTSRQMGRSLMRSVADAKEVSVNFNRHGAGNKTEGAFGSIAGVFRNHYMFFNAGMQSMELLYRNMTKDKSTAIKTVAFMGAIPAAIGMAFASVLASQDDEKYSQIPSWDRRNNICIPREDGYVKIPLPIELRAFWGMGDIMASLDHPRLRTEESPAFAMLGQISQALPLDVLESGETRLHEKSGYIPLAPTLLHPILEYAANKDWTGKNIEKENKYEDVPYWARAYSSVPKPFVEICKWAHNKRREGVNTAQETDMTGDNMWLDPSMYNHILKSYFGGAYSMTAKFIGAFTSDDLKVSHLPMASRVWGDFTDREADQTTNAKYWAYKKEYDAFQKEVKNKENSKKVNHEAWQELQNSSRKKRADNSEKLFKQIDNLHKKMNKETDPSKKAIMKKQEGDLKRDLVDALDAIE